MTNRQRGRSPTRRNDPWRYATELTQDDVRHGIEFFQCSGDDYQPRRVAGPLVPIKRIAQTVRDLFLNARKRFGPSFISEPAPMSPRMDGSEPLLFSTSPSLDDGLQRLPQRIGGLRKFLDDKSEQIEGWRTYISQGVSKITEDFARDGSSNDGSTKRQHSHRQTKSARPLSGLGLTGIGRPSRLLAPI